MAQAFLILEEAHSHCKNHNYAELCALLKTPSTTHQCLKIGDFTFEQDANGNNALNLSLDEQNGFSKHVMVCRVTPLSMDDDPTVYLIFGHPFTFNDQEIKRLSKSGARRDQRSTWKKLVQWGNRVKHTMFPHSYSTLQKAIVYKNYDP